MLNSTQNQIMFQICNALSHDTFDETRETVRQFSSLNLHDMSVPHCTPLGGTAQTPNERRNSTSSRKQKQRIRENKNNAKLPNSGNQSKELTGRHEGFMEHTHTSAHYGTTHTHTRHGQLFLSSIFRHVSAPPKHGGLSPPPSVRVCLELRGVGLESSKSILFSNNPGASKCQVGYNCFLWYRYYAWNRDPQGLGRYLGPGIIVLMSHFSCVDLWSEFKQRPFFFFMIVILVVK